MKSEPDTRQSVVTRIHKRVTEITAQFSPDHPVQTELTDFLFLSDHFVKATNVARYEEILKACAERPDKFRMLYWAGRLVHRYEVLACLARLDMPELEKLVATELCAVFTHDTRALPFIKLCLTPELRADPSAWLPHLEAHLREMAPEFRGERKQLATSLRAVLRTVIVDLPGTLRVFHQVVAGQVRDLNGLTVVLNNHPVILCDPPLRRAAASRSEETVPPKRTATGRLWVGGLGS